VNNQKGKIETKRRIIVLLLFAVAVLAGALLFLVPVYQGDFVPLPEVSGELEQSARIDLNQADLETLCLLPGVGEVKARRILEYRQEHGPFASLQELDQVEGIGPKTIESWEGLAWVS
jgi:competence protein ComEA